MNSFVRASMLILFLFFSACGTLEISVDRAPTPDISLTGTISALQTQNAELETKIAAISSPAATSAPALTSTPIISSTSSPASRITFVNGSTVGMVKASIQPGETQNYVLGAFQDQPMFVYVGSLKNDVTLSITRQDGTHILDSAANQISWQGSLLQSGDYYLTVHGGASSENFSLTVTIPSRIQFDEGANSATLSGETVSGYNVSYVVFATKGQKMNINLGDLSGKASLSVYGFTDGQTYLHSNTGQTSYHFILPSTQDYIVVVVPTADTVISYNLMVKIQ